jgi:trk system potassium uptake protein
VLLRPDRADYRLVALNLSRVLTVVGLLMLLPALLGAVLGEVRSALTFVVAAGTTLAVGQLGSWRLAQVKEATTGHGMVIAGLAWLVAPLFGAIPLLLSGHYDGWLDAYFDAMSGFATAGLSVIQDLDHVPDSLNLWRHLMQYAGGQGLVLAVLVLFAPGGGAMTMYVGEAREERILPNIRSTARFIGRISLGWLAVATPVYAVILLLGGLGPWDAVFHGLSLFMAAFSTGGFAPQSASVGFYHSGWLEVALGVAMVAGATSFGVHHLLVTRRWRDVARHLEVRTLLGVGAASTALLFAGLAVTGTYDGPGALRRGLFYAVSAQTTTGFATLPARTLVTDWGALAPAMVVLAMMVGAMSGSTGGGIKVVRVGLAGRAARAELRRVLSPPDAHIVEHYRVGTTRRLTPDVLIPALLVLLGFLLLYGVGALVGMAYGYPFDQAFFESTSSAATVGLSVGLTGQAMPAGLQVTSILQMWMGRLELVAAVAAVGFIATTLRGRV